MKSQLIVNPLASVERFEETGDLISGGPVPGRGMRYLTLSASDQPKLHSLFSELSQTGLGTLDLARDLTPDEIVILEDHGILVSPDNVPERPLFSCMLDDVEPMESNGSKLIVNPTFEFEPFDLTKFRTWMQAKHLSPYHATVWVSDPQTEVRWGYWLTPHQAEVVKQLEQGSPAADIDDALAGRLRAASVLVEADAQCRSDLQFAAEQFRIDRYAIVDDMVPPAQLKALQTYLRRYVDQGFMKFGDNQVSRRFAEHGEHVASMVHNAFKPVMQRIAGEKIQPTYAYSATYIEGAELVPHTDRDACVFSFSIQIDYSPDPADGVSPWALYLANDLDVDPESDTAVRLANGSCLAYKGRELVHYRTPLPAGHRSTSLFFHYIPE